MSCERSRKQHGRGQSHVKESTKTVLILAHPGPLSGPHSCKAHDPARSIQLAAKARKGAGSDDQKPHVGDSCRFNQRKELGARWRDCHEHVAPRRARAHGFAILRFPDCTATGPAC